VIPIDEPTNPLSAAFLKEIGAVAFVMAHHRRHQHRPVKALPDLIAPAVIARQIRIYYAPHGAPLGYITWAWLSPDSESRWFDDPEVSWHQSEWTDGEVLWVIDFLTLPGFERQLLNHARTTLFADQKSIKALRRNADGVARKVLTWHRCNGIWRVKDTQWCSSPS
jgi:cytolysin-activating lysine-acyltransferase